MATCRSSRAQAILTVNVSLSLLLFVFPQSCDAADDPLPLKICNFDAIYQLGDSISDTGNYIRESPKGANSTYARLPYGQTLNNPTGRCSDGHLMIDFFAKAAGLPLLNPYLERDASFAGGVNFAVVGATALTPQFLSEKFNIISPLTNTSLLTQLDSMFTYFNHTCPTDKCASKAKSALFMVGEIGGNDVNYAIVAKPIQEVMNLVPYVIQAIKDAVRKITELGPTQIIVPGNFPIGCSPIYLTAFRINDSAAYDELGCLKKLNEFVVSYNNQLQQAIGELAQQHPNVVIVYGDYYNALLSLIRHARQPGTGFDDVESLLKACCGTGGDYDYNPKRKCGTPDVPVCADPNRRISWDGIHFTQRAYQIMSEWLIADILPKLGDRKVNVL